MRKTQVHLHSDGDASGTLKVFLLVLKPVSSCMCACVHLCFLVSFYGSN